MKLITLEEHFTTQRFQDAASAFGRTPTWRPDVLAGLLNIGAERISGMDAAGIDVQVLSITAFGLYEMEAETAATLAADANDHLAAAMAAYPGRFNGFASLPMQDPTRAAKEFERCVKDLGFVGAMVDGTVEGKFLDDPKFLPVFEKAVELDVPIYLHPAPPPAPVMAAYTGDLEPPFNFLMSAAGWGWHVETGLHCLRLMLSGLFDRLPTLKIIIGHMGENLPYSIVRSNTVLTGAGLKRDRSPLEVFQQNFWITNSGYFSLPPVLCAREILSWDRIMLSVDYPFSPMAKGKEMLSVIQPIVSEQQLEAFAGGNAAKLLKLP